MTEGSAGAGAVRCLTRALKNARHLQDVSPGAFARDPRDDGFGTGVPMEVLRGLHRMSPESPALRGLPDVAEAIRVRRPPTARLVAGDSLFSGTVHFAQLTFRTSGGDITVPTPDMNQIVRYAQHAAVSISEYAAQYGQNSITVASQLLTGTVDLIGASFTDGELRSWVDDLAEANHFFRADCIVVIVPQGVSASSVSGNAGYHSLATIPYAVAGVDATGLTLADRPDVYAMVVSHEIAEMVVDPNVDGDNPEVCDPCDINCGNLTRCYFDAFDNYLGTATGPVSATFPFSYYTCAIVRPEGAAGCPPAPQDCRYPPLSRNRLARTLAVARSADRRLELFTVGGSGALQHIWQVAVGGGWSSWTSHGSPATVALIGPPALAPNPQGRLELFAAGADGAVWHIWQTAPNNGWSGWTTHGSPATTNFAGTPGLALATSGGTGSAARLELFGIGGNGLLWRLWQVVAGGGWSDWAGPGSPPGVRLVGAPAVTAGPDGRLELFAVGSDAALWHIWQLTPGGLWSDWTAHGSPPGSGLTGSPALALNAGGRLELLVAGSDGGLWHIWQVVPGGGWNGWTPHGAPPGSRVAGSPTMILNAGGRLELFVVGEDGALWHLWQTAPSGGWSSWLSHGRALGTELGSPPALAADADGRIELLTLASEAGLWHIWQTAPAGGWSSWFSHGVVPD